MALAAHWVDVAFWDAHGHHGHSLAQIQVKGAILAAAAFGVHVAF